MYYVTFAIHWLVAGYLGYWLGRRLEFRDQWMARCVHRWDYRSLDNLDRGWERLCLDCPKRESVSRNQVPYEHRSRTRNFLGL